MGGRTSPKNRICKGPHFGNGLGSAPKTLAKGQTTIVSLIGSGTVPAKMSLQLRFELLLDCGATVEEFTTKANLGKRGGPRRSRFLRLSQIPRREFGSRLVGRKTYKSPRKKGWAPEIRTTGMIFTVGDEGAGAMGGTQGFDSGRGPQIEPNKKTLVRRAPIPLARITGKSVRDWPRGQFHPGDSSVSASRADNAPWKLLPQNLAATRFRNSRAGTGLWTKPIRSGPIVLYTRLLLGA